MISLRKKQIVGLVSIVFCLVFTQIALGANSTISENPNLVADTVEKVSPAVVNIDTLKTVTYRSPLTPFLNDPFFRRFFNIPEDELERQIPSRGIGTGFIFRDDGYILTNEHVISGADEIKVTFLDGQEFEGRIVGSDPLTDIAVVKIEAEEKLPTIPLGDSDQARVGEWVIAIGNPYGFSHTVTVGVLGAKGRPVYTGDAGREYENFLQTDAAINPGNSGGPLLNLAGEVIGINTAIIPYAQGIGFAIPINMAKSIIDQLIEKGKVVRAWLGVYIQDLTPEIAEQFGLEEPRGALVADIVAGGPAEEAGIQRGDVILKVGSSEITDVKHLQQVIRSHRPGDKTTVEVWRDGKLLTLEVVLEELPQEETSLAVPQTIDLGLEVEEITSDHVKQFALKRERGVVIVSIQPGGVADQAGLRLGDVVLEINRRPVESLNDWYSALSEVEPGKTVLFLIDRGGRTYYVPVKTMEEEK
ncbi:MAG: serine protease Do [Candidatus Atribacteria bacterium]|nr:serine protease Do [Candidatus Atribacteria bacterium]